MWSRAGAIVALAAGAAVLSAPLSAQATDPVDLAGAYVVDESGVLAGSEDRVIAALDELYEETGIQFFAVYVPTFTGALDAADWADSTAIANGFGANDVLLAVATESRQYGISVDAASPLTDSQFSQLEADVEAELREDRWADAAIAAAESLGDALGSGPAPQPVEPVQPDTGESDSGGIPILPILGGAAVIGGGIYLFSRLRRRGKDGAVTAKPDAMTLKQLETRAGSLLVQLDDSLKTSEQELGFAIAQFGEAPTAEFTAALARAKATVAEAFALKQQLDDSQPEPDSDKRSMNTRIIELCEAADAELDAQADAFDELRQLESNATGAINEETRDLGIARARIPEIKAILDRLASNYSDAATQPITDNLAQATKLLDFADSSIASARTALGEERTSDAAVAVRAAGASVGQATQLMTAVATLSDELDAASKSLDALIADTTQDIAAARALPRDATAAPLEPALSQAATALAAAEAARKDPVAAVARLAEANLALETVFTGVRDAQARATSAAAQLTGAIAAARAQLDSTTSFITTRRGAVREPARTRASEADRQLQQATALATSDPVAALTAAKQANDLATSAFQLARSDVDRFSASESYSTPPWPGGTGEADLGGLLGGLLEGMISGSGGGYRSSGSSWGGSSSSRSSRSSRSSSFGGSSRSSGRSSGGRRSRGGRF